MCKTRSFHPTDLVLVWSRLELSRMPNPFFDMRMYCMCEPRPWSPPMLGATGLDTTHSWLLFSVLFELSLVRSRTKYLVSLGYWPCVWNPL